MPSTRGTLPVTGLPSWLTVLVAMAVLGSGLLARWCVVCVNEPS